MNIPIDEHFPFDSYWDFQKEVIEEIVRYFKEDDGKFFILEAPTGSGKSVIAYTVAKIFKQLSSYSSVILTKNRSLQCQYRDQLNIPSLWSATHYDCELDPGNSEYYYRSPNCLVGCPEKPFCNYLRSEEAFRASNVGVLNYHY